MDPHIIFLSISIILNVVLYSIVGWTIYEFEKLESNLFRYYIIGFIFYTLGSIGFFLRYLVFPPLSSFESAFFGLLGGISPLLGLFYLLKGTEYLAKEETDKFSRNESLTKIIFYLLLSIAIIQAIYMPLVGYSDTMFELMRLIALILFFITFSLAFKLLYEYKKFFNPTFAKIVQRYAIAIVLYIIGGVSSATAYDPIEYGGATFSDLSYLRVGLGLIGTILAFMPFIIFYKSVHTFRKTLMT